MPRWFGVIERDPLVRTLLRSPAAAARGGACARVVGEAYRQLAFAARARAAGAVVARSRRHHRDRGAVARLPRHRPAAAARARRARSDLQRIRCPVLLIWGDARPHGHPPRLARRSLDALPETRLRAAGGRRALPAARGARSRRRAARRISRRRSRRRRSARYAHAPDRRWPTEGHRLPAPPTPDRSATPRPTRSTWSSAAGVADLRRTPARDHRRGAAAHGLPLPPRRRPRAPRALPVLLVPPLAAPATCFDLRRGCSLAEHMLAARAPDLPGRVRRHRLLRPRARPRALGRGRPAQRRSGGSARTPAARPCSSSAGAWAGSCRCSRVAGDAELPVSGVAMVASPFDFTRVRLMAPIRPGGQPDQRPGAHRALPALGGAPAPLVSAASSSARSTST